jgi:uncharacterized protein (TIGR03067 family)
MMIRLCALLVLFQFFSAGMATQTSAHYKAKKQEQPKLDGIWKLVEWKMDGDVKPPDHQPVQMVIAGNMFQMKLGEKVYDEGTFTVDRDAMPKTIDIKHVDEKFQGKINLGIYEFKKQDELWMAISRAGNAKRPVDFTSQKGTDHAVYWFRRQ